MRFIFVLNRGRSIFGSLGSFFLILALLWFNHLMVASRGLYKAMKQTCDFRKKEGINQIMENLKMVGMSSPNTDTADRLKTDKFFSTFLA